MPKDDTFTRILVASDALLVDRRFYVERVWTPARSMHKHIGSYPKWLDALTVLYDFDGRLYYPDNGLYRHPEITDVFEDQTNHWMGDFLRCDGSGHFPKRFCRKVERLRLIELYCRLMAEPKWPV